MGFQFSSVFNALKVSLAVKYSITFFIAVTSYQAFAAPSNMGTITVTSSDSNGNATGTYKAAGSEATGSFTLTRKETRGYNNNVVITAGSNGIEIRNDDASNNHNDSFTYIFTITPTNNTAIHTIKIGQASYATEGNSEVARHTISNVIQNNADIPSRIYAQENPSVPFYYEAMGDYFMGRREPPNSNTFRYNVATSEPQLRSNSSNSLYFYKIDELAGSDLTGNSYQPSTTNNEVRFANSTSRGVLPLKPTFANILKSTSTNNQSTFTALGKNQTIIGNSYVTYGVENSNSRYVVAARNAVSLTLTYDAIMNGSNAFPGNIIGETFKEWISFGVESEPLNFIFSGTVFNDNGGITTPIADNVGPPYSNNNDYFNGVLNSTEASIAGSRVRVVDNCNNPTQTFATQTLAASGSYSFTIPVTEIGNRTSVCIIEDNNSSYPIRTTIDKRQVVFTTNNYTYRDFNFGRVTDANRALVLRKEQSVNNCTISSFTDLTYSKDTINNTPPGQCIAYKITANNRANLPISNFIMQDELPTKGREGSTVTSVLALPERVKSDYADTLATGSNGTIVTNTFTLNSKSNRSFYFNTKYGTTR